MADLGSPGMAAEGPFGAVSATSDDLAADDLGCLASDALPAAAFAFAAADLGFLPADVLQATCLDLAAAAAAAVFGRPFAGALAGGCWG